MKNKIINLIIILCICFLIAPLVLYCILGMSSFKNMLYLIPKAQIIKMYMIVSTIGLILYVSWKCTKKLLLHKLKLSPIIKSELISIEKLDQKSMSLGFMEIDIETEDIYIVKFKHKNKIIDTIIKKNDIKKDLSTNENPYVEYQCIKFVSFFSKIKNIKVHTSKK